MTSPKIPEGLQAFLRHAESLHPSNNARRENGFAKEFQQLKDMSSKLKRDPEYTTHHGENDYNRPKNRYKDILPFDRNRVILPTLPGIPGSDYINGNYVKGPDGKTAYLALQGPLPRTVDDFWRLIASHKCQIVIMVCREIEMGKLKCKRYWPESKDEKLSFAGLEISLISEDDIAEGFVMRTMCMKAAREEMTVTQLQYTAWPDHDVPRSAAPLIELNKTLRAVQGNREQNLLIHCSAGCGRTGTICAVDYAWTLLKTQKTNNFSVYDIVADLRRQRMAMVQTKEQYALVYKAVVQLVQEELDKEKLKSHTYVNVEIPGALPQSQSGRGDYENCEFVKSVSRWKQSDLQNGSVPKASMPLPAPKEAKANTKPQPRPANRLPMPTSKSEGAAVIKSNAPTKTNYVNLEFTPEVTKNEPVLPVKEGDVPILAQPKSPPRGNTPSLNLTAAKGGKHSPVVLKPNSPPTNIDYEVLPKKTTGSTVSSLGNEIAPQRNKGLSADYEFPAMSAAGVDKKQSKQHVPEGLLIDLGDDVPPLPSKRHSVGSVTKDGSRYENVEVKPFSSSGFGSQRSASSPNVLDDSWPISSSCLQPTVGNLPQRILPGNAKEHPDSRGFHTLPNRMHSDSGPKRCPLTAEAFKDPGTSGGGGGGGGFGVMQSPPGQYCLVGAVNPPSQSPPKTMMNPQVVPQPNQGSQLQKQRPAVEGRHSPQPKKQGDQPKPRTPVGAYSLVGIPEAGGLHAPSPVSTPATVKSENSKESTGLPVEVKEMSSTGFPVESKGKPTTGIPVEGKGKPIAEPSYELVGQWQQAGEKVSPPSVQPYKPGNAGFPNLDVTKGANGEPHSSPLLLHEVDKQNPVAKSKSTPDISLRGHGDGEPQTVNSVTVAPDVYATVVPRTRDKTEAKDRNSSNLSTESPNLRNQTSSGSLRSFTSTSSDEGDTPPAVPQKTNEAFLVPGEEPYEAVQQTNKGTLDRFKKMMKSGSKGSLTKRLSDVTMPLGLPRTNSSGTATVRWEEIGYKKRFPKPAGPRPCPAHWPSCVHLGL